MPCPIARDAEVPEPKAQRRWWWTVVHDARHRAHHEGRRIFNNACRTCHSIQNDDIGSDRTCTLSLEGGPARCRIIAIPALKEAGFTWDEETLDRFIANPDEMMPGNRMKPYGGMASAHSRADVIAFLRSLANGQ